MSASSATMRQKLGCWLNERWRAELVLMAPRLAGAAGVRWLDLRNRNERVRDDAASGGRICDWNDSSRYTAARVFPGLAPRLLRHALREWPLQVAEAPARHRAELPSVSIIIPIGGTDRLAQFDLSLNAARAQGDVDCEVVVVEQSSEPTLAGRLPPDVTYLHQPKIDVGGFNKSRALNTGAHAARGDVLVILDGDYLLPTAFARECARVLREKEAVRPARWIFYLDAESTAALSKSRDPSRIAGVEAIVSNNPTPFAIRRSAYWEIGGHDEDYIGWGGEDTEFLDRLRTRQISEGGWMPVVHAWHPVAPKKADGDRNRGLHAAKMAVPAVERIARLLAMHSGRHSAAASADPSPQTVADRTSGATRPR